LSKTNDNPGRLVHNKTALAFEELLDFYDQVSVFWNSGWIRLGAELTCTELICQFVMTVVNNDGSWNLLSGLSHVSTSAKLNEPSYAHDTPVSSLSVLSTMNM
jgi:hypothetical protein